MLNKKKIISAAISISMAMGVVSPQLAYAYEDKNSEYYQIEGYSAHYAQDKNQRTWFYSNLKNGTIALWGTQDAASYLEIPATLDGKTVTVIESIVVGTSRTDPEYGKKPAMVTKIKIPQTVKIIGWGAFFQMKNLKDIEMPQNIKVAENVFESCPNVRVNGITNTPVPTDTSNLVSGWNFIGNDRYYVNSSGKFQNGWMDLNGKRYYFYGNGQMAVAFINLGDDSVYYLDPTPGDNMGNLITGWKNVDKNWFYFNVTGQNGREKGFMQTGWLYNNGSWYYFYGNGQMATGLINLGNDSYYYLDQSNSSSMGIMRTGWQKINGYWHYFNKSASEGIVGIMKKGWQKIDGKWYYFYYDNGRMAYNTWIDGYYVNSSGAWAK